MEETLKGKDSIEKTLLEIDELKTKYNLNLE